VSRPLSEILAAQAKLYGQVSNAVWFARRIAADPVNASATKAIAEKYGVDWQAGMRELEPPGCMRRRQAGAA
jgi:hypothetical protein